MIKHNHCSQNVTSKTYKSYSGMKSRCYNPKLLKYKNHGGREITVCERWLGEDGFANFLSDMGERPADMTLDRLDNNGDYTPDNCRWATYLEQNNNTRFNKLLNFSDENHTLAEWGRKLGVDRRTINARLRGDWSVDEALSAPVASKNKTIEYSGEKMSLTGWAERLGIKYTTLWYRLFEQNWSTERAFTTPVRRREK